MSASQQLAEKQAHEPNRRLAWTQLYRELGWSVIPIAKGKKVPVVAWEPFQRRHPTNDEIHEWFEWSDVGVGIVTGMISRIVVLDLDSENARKNVEARYGPLPSTPCVRTGNGWHFYFQHPGVEIRNFSGKLVDVDLRGDGGFVVAPPSIHDTGAVYEWITDPRTVEIAACPPWLVELARRASSRQTGDGAGIDAALRDGVAEGERHDAATRIAGRILGRGGSLEDTLLQLHAWNQKNWPPLRDDEIERVVRDLWSRETSKAKRTPKQAGQLLTEAETTEILEEALTAAKPGGNLNPLFDRLRGLDPINYKRIRKSVADVLAVGVIEIDAAVGPVVKPAGGAANGHALELHDDEPDDEPQDAAAVLHDLAELFRRHVVLPAHADVALALWAAWTYAVDCFRIAPILAIRSPQKRCGKTTLLSVLCRVVKRALPASNVSPSAVFRVVEKEAPTVMIDEAETALHDNEPLRGILNSGHTRDAAFVVRCVGDSHEPQTFSTWGAKALALIGALPPTLHDRSITIALRRKHAGESAISLDELGRDACDLLRGRIARLVGDYGDALTRARPERPPGLHDRAWDNWRPLIAIADLAGDDWAARARSAAAALSAAADEDEEEIAVLLLYDIREVFEQHGMDRVATDSLLNALNRESERPWFTLNRGKELDARGLAKRLKPYGISPRATRTNDGNLKGYILKDFADAFSRYLPPKDPSQRHNPRKTRGFEDSVPSQGNGSVTDAKHENARKDAECDRVTAESGGIAL